MLTFGYTIIYVEDVAKTVAFYETAFGLVRKFVTPEEDYGELETGSTTLAFASYSVADYNSVNIERRTPSALPSPVEIVFVCKNIKVAYDQAVAAGAEVVQEPAEKPWGQMVGYVRDNNGFLVELCTAASQ